MRSTALISPHDPVGTNLFGHVLRGRLMRVVPRENEAINETWIADRDRFSYEGVYSPDRLAHPLLRRADTWVETDWESALMQVAQGLRARAPDLGVLASSSGTLEELYLAGRIARGLNSHNVDHRLRQRDFRDQQADPVFPGLGMHIAEVDSLDALLVIGANLRREVPILAHRVRKAVLRGAQVAMLNPARFPYRFPVKAYLTCAPADLAADLAAVVAAAAAAAGKPVPRQLGGAVGAARVSEAHRAAAQVLLGGGKRAVWLGALAARHAAFADLRALAAALAQITGASLGRRGDGGGGVRVGEARPGWKVLRVLGTLLGLEGFDYQSSEDVLREVREACAALRPAGYQGTHAVREADEAGAALGAALVDVPMYQTDALLRRAPSLQRTREGRTPAVTYRSEEHTSELQSRENLVCRLLLEKKKKKKRKKQASIRL